MRLLKLYLVIVFVLGSLAVALAEDKSTQDEIAIKRTIKSYVEAFNRGDAKALAAHWTINGTFIGPSGEEFVGRDKLEAALKNLFKQNKGIKLEVTPLAIYVESPNKAIEEGVAVTTRSDGDRELTRYVAKHVKDDGKWKIAKLREVVPLDASPHYEKLKVLEWMIGEWVDEDATGRLETRCFWSKNQNFLVRSFSISVGGRTASEGKQIIGWDPALKQIRSWVFDSNGGFGEGIWSKQGESWHVKSAIVLTTGEKASSINVLTPVNDNSFTWQSTGREVGGELLPNSPKVTVVRKQTESTPSASADK
jgi:uncharacterized protein (TIGR02246 family)